MDEATTPLLQLPPSDLTRLLRSMAGADGVELKLTVPEDNRQSTLAALELDPLDAQIRQVAFFDTPDLALDRAGTVLRARRVQGRSGDSVVKLRPVVPEQLDPKLRTSPRLGVEVDAMPGGFVCSASMKAKVPDEAVRWVLSGRGPVRDLFDEHQRSFAATRLPGGVGIDDLVVLGPISVLKLKFMARGLHHRLVAEQWHYPDGSRVLELSTKCEADEAFQLAAELRAFLGGRGVELDGRQVTKTRTALEMLSSERSAAAAG